MPSRQGESPPRLDTSIAGCWLGRRAASASTSRQHHCPRSRRTPHVTAAASEVSARHSERILLEVVGWFVACCYAVVARQQHPKQQRRRPCLAFFHLWLWRHERRMPSAKRTYSYIAKVPPCQRGQVKGMAKMPSLLFLFLLISLGLLCKHSSCRGLSRGLLHKPPLLPPSSCGPRPFPFFDDVSLQPFLPPPPSSTCATM